MSYLYFLKVFLFLVKSAESVNLASSIFDRYHRVPTRTHNDGRNIDCWIDCYQVFWWSTENIVYIYVKYILHTVHFLFLAVLTNFHEFLSIFIDYHSANNFRYFKKDFALDTYSFFLYHLGNFWYSLVHFGTHSAILVLFDNFWSIGLQIGSDIQSALGFRYSDFWVPKNMNTHS